MVVAAACSDDASDGGSSPTATWAPTVAASNEGPPGDPPQTVTAADVAAGLERVPEAADAVLAATGVPGMAVTVVFDDEVVYAEGFGTRQVEHDDRIGPDTVFQVASLSKPIGATVVAGLVGDGAVSWSDPIVDHLDGFELSDPMVTERVTVADMYAHRSGLPDHAGDLLEDLGYDRDTIIERLQYLDLGPFRDSYAYTNFGLTTAAVAAASASGMSWDEAMNDVLFGPAGMDHSSARFDDYMAADDRAVPHQRDSDGTWGAFAQRDPDPQSPAGGVSSTAADMGTWMRIQLNEGRLGDEEIVDADALLAMHTPQITSAPPRTPSAHASQYGLGLNVGVRDDGYTQWSHSGAFLLGAGTTVGMIPGQHLGVAVLTNGQPVGASEAMVEIVLDLIIDGDVSRDWLGLYGPLFDGFYVPATPTDWSDRPADPSPPASSSTYIGTYDNTYFGPLEVSEQDGALVMTLGPADLQFPLEPFDGDTFLFTPPGENSLGPTGIEFVVVDGQATEVTAEFYDEYGLGTWTRVGDQPSGS